MKPADAIIAVMMPVVCDLAFAASRIAHDGFSPVLEAV